MSEGYIRLRDQLKDESPELHNTLMRSWAIAEREWLPAVSGNKGSFNSFPHLSNLEGYLDDILRQSRETYPESRALEMLPIEKYMMLAAILFHDIGRTIQGKEHAHKSRDLIKKNFADLGIESKRIADIIADICCYHDCSHEMEAKLDLRDHAVTPYGVIRCKTIADLLKFVDNLDTAYTRVLPHYLRQDEGSIIENFRRNTLGVRVDLRHQMVVTSIGLQNQYLSPSHPPKGKRAIPPWLPQRLKPQNVAYIGLPGVSTPKKGESPRWQPWSEVRWALNPEYTSSGQASLYMALVKLLEYINANESAFESLEKLRNTFRQLLRNIKKQLGEKGLGETALLIGLYKKLASKSMSIAKYCHYCRSNREQLEGEIDALFRKVASKSAVKFLCGNDTNRVCQVDDQPGSKRRPPFWVAERAASYVILAPVIEGPDRPDLTWRECVLPYLIMRKIVFPEFKENSGVVNLSRILFLVIAGAVRSSAKLLADQLKRPLSILSIPVEAWLVEYDEHLFTCAGHETFEPSLDKDFLCDVVEAMWNLSANMFGREPCSFRTLAAKLRFSNVDLVRTAVRRIAIVTRHKKRTAHDDGHQGTGSCYAIEFTRNDWRWCSREDGWSCEINDRTSAADTIESGGKQEKPTMNKHSQKWILEQIECLAEPAADTD